MLTALIRAGAQVMPALVVGFVAGTFANYVLFRALAFQGDRHDRLSEISRLVAVSLVGLGLTAILVWIRMSFGLPPLVAKFVATGPVLAWNYAGRRLFVFHREMPRATWALSDRASRSLRR